MRVGHVQRRVDLVDAPAAKPRCASVEVVEEADLVDLVQLPRLPRDIRRWKAESSEEVLRAGVVDLLGNDAAVPLIVELIDPAETVSISRGRRRRGRR